MIELTTDQQRTLIDRQVQAWLEKQFDVELAHKVHKRLGAAKEDLDRFAQELMTCEKALAILAEERAALDD